MPPEVRVDRAVVLAYLDDVVGELDVVKRLLSPPPTRFAVFHLQQAAEKLIKAVRLARGIPATKEHNLELLIEGLPEGDVWRE
jgi:HEPN domain-containing protein